MKNHSCFWVFILLLATACQESKRETYVREAKEYTAMCPIALDEVTTIDSMTYDAERNAFVYHYTLGTPLIADGNGLKAELCRELQNSPDMLPYMKDSVTFIYRFRYPLIADTLLVVEITPSLYLCP